MSPHLATAFADSAPSDPAPDQPEACPHCALGRRVEQRLAMLQELAELGMAAAREAKQRIVDQAERERGMAPDPTGFRDQIAKSFQLDFSRAAQAVRQTLALQERIEQDHLARIDREAAEAAARRAAAAQRRAAERQSRAEHRRTQVQAELARVIQAKASPKEVSSLIVHLNDRLRPERLDWDFGDAPLHEIFLRICRNLGVPESWSRQWGEDSEPEGSAHGDAPAPICPVGPANDARPHDSAGPDQAETPTQRQSSASALPGAVPDHRSSGPAAAPPDPEFDAPGTGPP
jgi:hypothetical protein